MDIREPHSAPSYFQFFQLDDWGSLDFDDESCEVVVSCDVLEHVASIEHSLNEVRRVLRVGGRIWTRAYHKDTKDHVRSLTKREMADLLGARFKIVRCEYS